MPLPNWHRESTPAYTDRSPSPSPISRHGDFDVSNDLDRIDGIDDIAMRDITPTITASRAFHRGREGSVAPSSAGSFSRSRFSVPRTSSPIYPSSPSRHLMPAPRSPRHESQPPSPRRFQDTSRTYTPAPVPPPNYTLIRAPPIPSSSSTIKPGKQRDKDKDKDKSRRKSGVQGSKIEKPKSRNVTAKKRKDTEKIPKPDMKDMKEAGAGAKKKDCKVAEAVAKIEERIQRDGTPPRRSERIKKRIISGSLRPEYRGLGG